jgi:MFS family permease
MKNKTLFQIYLLSALIYFTQGIEGLPGLAFFLYLKEHLGFTAEKVMYIGSITGFAWLVKPIWGYLCDNFLTKKLWIFLSLLGSIAIACYFGLSPFIALPVIIILLSTGNFNSAIRDVAVDGIMCIEGKENNNCDRIQAIQWTSVTIAGILASLGGGYIAQHFSYKLAYLCLIPVYIIILINAYFFSESKQSIIKGKFWASLVSYKELFTDKKFVFACLFLFLYKYSPGFGTPLMYIERDTFHWSAQFMGILGAIGSVLEIIGAIIFFKYCKKINIKKWLIFSVFLGAATTLLYLYFTPISAIIYGIAFSSIGMFVHLIVMAFMAKQTLPGREATSFALLCSISNLSATCSTLTGAWLYPIIGLKILIILSAVTSFICLPLIKKIRIDNA